jgi:hypothetical protein
MQGAAAGRALAAAAVVAAVAATGCGKKGSPLAPLVRIPAAVDKIAALRLGSDVYVTLTVPAANIDTSVPVSIARVDLYAYTGRTAPTPARWAELGTVVATIPVIPPPPIAAGSDSTQPIDAGPARAAAAGARPGAAVTILDTLTPDELLQGREIPIQTRGTESSVPMVAPSEPRVLRRFYLAVPFSERGRNGPPGAQAEVVLTAMPDPPTDLRATYGPSGVSLTWEPSGGLLGYLLDTALPPEPAPVDAQQPAAPPAAVDPEVPPGPTTYNIYRDLAPDPFVLPPPPTPPWMALAPIPMNPAPLAATTAADSVEFGRSRCYVVRALRGVAASEASPRTCIVPVDVFPPAVPTGLAAVPSEGGISLIWEPNADLDLGGYLVLRREARDATLRLLTAAPIGEARYRDTTVEPGARYSYSVVAVDTQLPLPNISGESVGVEETAR